jgi:hypothetical protein
VQFLYNIIRSRNVIPVRLTYVRKFVSAASVLLTFSIVSRTSERDKLVGLATVLKNLEFL